MYVLDKQTLRWLFYGVALITGITVAATLVFIAWSATLAEHSRGFTFESSKINATVVRNVQLSDDVLNFFATLITADQTSDDKIFQSSAKNILARQDFIEGIFYAPLDNHGDHASFGNSPLTMLKARFRGPDVAADAEQMVDHEYFDRILQSLSFSDRENGVAFMLRLGSREYYVLLRGISDAPAVLTSVKDYSNVFDGLLFLLIDPQKIIKRSDISPTLLVNLHDESSSLSGRKLLFSVADDRSTEMGWQAYKFIHNSIIQLPAHSMKLSISKNIYWQDIDKNPIYIVLLLGFGVTFLLFALLRTKNMHEDALIKHSLLIESKVEEQTRELVLSRDKAQESSHIKSDFLASMSHEIRTPLTAIISMAELLSETKLNKDQGKYVRVFRRAGDTLLNLVNDILDLSKIEAGQLVLERVPFDLQDVVEGAIELYAVKAAEHDTELISNVDPALHTQRMGDPSRLEQIISNLISNAIKFTEGGQIFVQARHVDADEICISVSDTGIGIPEEIQKEIFSSFIQADSSTARKYGGTGLGLTISQRLVDKMNGRIRLESEEGVGSTFSISVPLPAVDTVTGKDSKVAISLQDTMVLVSDPNQSSRDSIADVLRSYGAKCVTANIWLPEKSPEEVEKYQYILLDQKILLQYDDTNLASLKQLQALDAAPLIIALLSPISLQQQIKRINHVGIQNYLVKPIKRTGLEHIFLPSEARPTPVIEIPDTKKQILLVEDNEDNRLLIKEYLKKSPYILTEAENGEIAVNLYRKNMTYHLILMDIQMPIMDGHETTRSIRALEEENARPSVPIIALTAHATKEEIEKCTVAGCDFYLGKPIKKSILLNAIEDFIS